MASPWWVIGKPSGSAWTGVRVVQAPQGTSGGVAAFGGTLPSGYQVIAGPFGSSAAAQAAAPGAGGPSTSAPAAPVTQAPGCGPQAIYTALLAAGFSTAQAVGAMANAMNESRLNPETPAGDGGHSFGLWQFNDGSYPDAPHPTGNCARDIALAVGYLKTHVSGAALAGHTGAEVAGNFAANFERCVGCQQGGSQWSQRVANAATVEGWISSGKWPTASGGGVSGGGGGSGSSGSGGTSTGNVLTSTIAPGTCVIGMNIPVAGSFCLLSKGQARGTLGVLLMIAGGVLLLPGLLVLAAAGLEKTGAGPAAAKAAGVVPGTGKAMRKGAAYLSGVS